jgi:hypothetical protein
VQIFKNNDANDVKLVKIENPNEKFDLIVIKSQQLQ